MPGAFIKNDIAAMLDTEVFGIVATYRGASVTGIFDDDDVEIVTGEGHTTIIPQPTFTGRTVDFPTIFDGDAITIATETFKIKNWKKEDDVIELFLERPAA